MKDILKGSFAAASFGLQARIFDLIGKGAVARAEDFDEFEKLVATWYSPAYQNSLKIAGRGGKEAVNFSGRTFATEAAMLGRVEMINALAKAGADMNMPDAKGWTPLTSAAISGHDDIVRALGSTGVDMRTADVNGRTAFGVAWSPRVKQAIMGCVTDATNAMFERARVSVRSGPGSTSV